MIPDLPPPLVWPHAWRPPKKCDTCDGHGVIGGLQSYGYDCAECPTCNGIGTHTPETETP